MKLVQDLNHYVFDPLRLFFLNHLRFSPVNIYKLILFGLMVNFLLMLMLATDNYLFNFLAALLMIPVAGFMEAIGALALERHHPSFKYKVSLMLLFSESLIYTGALLHNAGNADALFAAFAAFSIIGLWLRDRLNERMHIDIKIFSFPLRYALLALMSILTLNFIYFLVFSLLLYGQMAVSLKYLLKKHS